jgi:hypothetical protein
MSKMNPIKTLTHCCVWQYEGDDKHKILVETPKRRDLRDGMGVESEKY